VGLILENRASRSIFEDEFRTQPLWAGTGKAGTRGALEADWTK
jgi:hypothetical protein